MRNITKIASGDTENLGDTSTLLNPEIVDDLQTGLLTIDKKRKNYTNDISAFIIY